jgi:adenylate cyclase
MTEVVQNRHGGYLSKFMGDGVFVFFGAPVSFDDHAGRALQSALECQAQLKEFNEVLKAEWGTSEGLVSRIGVATGEVMVGNCGSTDKFDYTAIGPTVNLASRLEGANKSFGTRILVDEATWKGAFPAGPGAADGVVARCMGKILVVGENEPAVVWNPLGRRGEVPAPIEKAADDFTAAVRLYADRDFAAAAELLEACLKAVPGDAAAELFLDLCRKNIALPPGPDWDGIVQLTHK